MPSSQDDPQPLSAKQDDLERELCKRHLLDFARLAIRIVWPRKTFAAPWHVGAICEHLEALARREIRGLVVNIPPRHLKSSLVSVFWPAWVWTLDPAETFLTASYSSQLAVRDAIRMRRIVESDWYQRLWPGVKLVSDQNAKTRYENTAGGFRQATSVGGTVTGEGGSIRILDDPHKTDAATSEADRASDIMWLRETWSTREDGDSVEALVMQRIHEQDATAVYLEDHPGYVHLCLPAHYDPDRRCKTTWGGHTFEDRRTEPNSELWPERPGQPLDEISRALGPHAAASQLEQMPSVRGGNLVKGEWFRFWDVLPDGCKIVQSWDCTFKETKRGSFVVGQLWACKWPMCYLLDEVRGRMDFVATQDALLNRTAVWDARGWRSPVKLVEDKANGSAIISSLRSITDGIREWPVAGGDKTARMSAETALMAAGQVLLPNPALHPWVREWIAELERFPHEPNDRGDACSQALHYFRDQNTVADTSDFLYFGS